jgi:hypothetical protein
MLLLYDCCLDDRASRHSSAPGSLLRPKPPPNLSKHLGDGQNVDAAYLLVGKNSLSVQCREWRKFRLRLVLTAPNHYVETGARRCGHRVSLKNV